MSQTIAVATAADPHFEEGQGGALSMDLTGHLRTTGGGGGGGGTSEIDESPFTAGVTPGTPIMGEDPTSGEVLILQTEPGTRILKVSAGVPVSDTASAPSQQTIGNRLRTGSRRECEPQRFSDSELRDHGYQARARRYGGDGIKLHNRAVSLRKSQ